MCKQYVTTRKYFFKQDTAENENLQGMDKELAKPHEKSVQKQSVFTLKNRFLKHTSWQCLKNAL